MFSMVYLKNFEAIVCYMHDQTNMPFIFFLNIDVLLQFYNYFKDKKPKQKYRIRTKILLCQDWLNIGNP